MIQAHMSKEYYDGARDALYEYAVHRADGLEVGSTGKKCKAAVAEVDELQEKSENCAIWRLMRDTHTASPAYPDSDQPPDWTGPGIDATRWNICYLLAAMCREVTPEKMSALYQEFVRIATANEARVVGNRQRHDDERGPYVLVTSRSLLRAMMDRFLSDFAEAFRYTEEFRCQKG